MEVELQNGTGQVLALGCVEDGVGHALHTLHAFIQFNSPNNPPNNSPNSMDTIIISTDRERKKKDSLQS